MVICGGNLSLKSPIFSNRCIKLFFKPNFLKKAAINLGVERIGTPSLVNISAQ